MSPFNAWTFLQGIETLNLRMERHSENALKVARFLENHKCVSWVRYPGLESSPTYNLKDKYLPKGQGALLGFGIKGGKATAVRFIESLEGARIDMLENGGGDGSMSVISPQIFQEYGLPYDQQTTAALHEIGIKTAYHTCGKMMAQLDLVKQTGCDASETLTPPDMGGDADLAQIKEVLGDSMCLIGGFDQQQGFERGTPETIRRQIEMCWEQAGPGGGYIMAASDHFFEGDPENVRTYVETAKEFRY